MKKIAFTLAEVLVTLSIIGVVSAMTVPTLMNKNNEKQTIVALKSAYSTLSNAARKLSAELGDMDNWGDLQTVFVPYLKVARDCKLVADSECMPSHYKSLNGKTLYSHSLSWFYKVQLQNGITYAFNSDSSDQIKVFVDINGRKGPNANGKDLFAFIVTGNSVIPRGAQVHTGSFSLDEGCKFGVESVGNGLACTAWVIYKGNMDYLRKQVSWDE